MSKMSKKPSKTVQSVQIRAILSDRKQTPVEIIAMTAGSLGSIRIIMESRQVNVESALTAIAAIEGRLLQFLKERSGNSEEVMLTMRALQAGRRNSSQGESRRGTVGDLDMKGLRKL